MDSRTITFTFHQVVLPAYASWIGTRVDDKSADPHVDISLLDPLIFAVEHLT